MAGRVGPGKTGGASTVCCSPAPTAPRGWSFEHVVVLDGEWDRKNVNEDLDAPRRLYYVAMTRAQKDPHPGRA